jgi:hypothetical protein
MLVGICIPCYGSMPFEFVKCLMALQAAFLESKIPHFFNIQSSSFLPHTRAKCLGANLERGIHQLPFDNKNITHLVLLDTDIIFKPQQVIDLLNRKVDFVAAMYPYSISAYDKESSKQIVAGMWNEDDFRKYKLFPPLTIGRARSMAASSGNELIEVDWAGLGLAVIKPKVLLDIEYPWFASELISIDDLVDTTSEDVGFCRKVVRAGYKIHLDTKVRVQHFKSFAV